MESMSMAFEYLSAARPEGNWLPNQSLCEPHLLWIDLGEGGPKEDFTS